MKSPVWASSTTPPASIPSRLNHTPLPPLSGLHSPNASCPSAVSALTTPQGQPACALGTRLHQGTLPIGGPPGYLIHPTPTPPPETHKIEVQGLSHTRISFHQWEPWDTHFHLLLHAHFIALNTVSPRLRQMPFSLSPKNTVFWVFKPQLLLILVSLQS